MRAVSGVDLVSAALHSSLSRAQKRFNFTNPGSISKKKLKREKILENKLKRKFSRLKDSPYQQLLASPGSSFSEFDGDWNSSSLKNFQVEFEPVENEFSTFISKLKEKYTCLNPKKKVGKKAVKKVKKLLFKNSSSPSSETKPLLPSIEKPEKDDDVDSGLGLEEIIPSNPVSLLQQLRQKKLEARRERKKKRKEALKLEEQKQKLLKLKAKKMKDMSNGTSSESHGHGNGSNGSSNSEKISQGPQLPQPKIVLYPREKIVQGWTQKYHYGAGLYNLGNSCYMNATLQALFHTPAFVNWLLQDEDHSQRCRSNTQSFQQCLVCAMKSTLKESLNRNNNCIRPIQIHNKLKAICKHFQHCRQEDAHEFMRYLLESMERSYLSAINALRIDNRSRETTPLGQIFGGYLRTEVTCLKCNCISTTFQPLAELQLDIRHVTTLEDAINNHFKKERLDNNDYKCEKCHTMSPATKQFSLEVPPIVLCLQLKRFTLSGGKISKPIHCNQRLNLNRFLHKSLRENHANVQYRLVGLVTHIGSSPHCGHYTAIAEASNGYFYQFDDSYVRQISIQTALNTDAYMIIYEMESNPQPMKSPVINCNSSGLSNAYKSGFLSNGIKPTSTVTKPENSLQPEPKKYVNPFLKTTPTSANGGGSGLAKSGTTSVTTSAPTQMLNGYNASLSGLPSKDRPLVSFNIQKNSTTGTSTKSAANPKILFKNPNAPMPCTTSYLTPSCRTKLFSTTENSANGSNGSEKPKKKSPTPEPLNGSTFKNIIASSKTINCVGPSNVTPKKETAAISLGISFPTKPAGSISAGVTTKSTSSTQPHSKLSKLVAYDTDDEDEVEEPPAVKKDAEKKETDTPALDTSRKESRKERSASPGGKQRLFPIFKNMSSVKSWNNTESALSTSLDASRKRSLEKSKDDIFNEELDAGKVKKSRSHSKSKSRSPVREYPRSQDKLIHSNNTTPPLNKFQRYEDNRRSVGEQLQILQKSSSSTPAPTTAYSKPVNGYHNHSSDNYRRHSSENLYDSSGSGSSSSGRNDYFAKKGYHHNKGNYAFNNNFKKYNSSSNFYSSNSYYNKNKGYNNGWRNNNNGRRW